MSRISKELGELKNMFSGEIYLSEDGIEELVLDAKFIYDLKENLSYIVDGRHLSYVLHSCESIILCVIFALIANCNDFVQIHLFMKKHYEWLDKHVGFDCGLPSISTVKRVIAIINPKELETICVEAINSFLEKNKPLYKDDNLIIEDKKSMDGKTANASDRKSSKEGEIAKTNAMSIYSVKKGYCEATEFIHEKTNEIPTGVELLKRVNVKNCVILFDAMSTQTATINYIVDNKGYYVAPVKGNQGNLLENIKSYFDDESLLNKAKEKGYRVVKEKAHGDIEEREYIFTNDIDWLYKKDDWKDLKAIGVAIRKYKNDKGEDVEDKRYFITNLDYNKIELISSSIRDEWKVENNLHFFLDMVFQEDKNKSFLENSQKNLNIMRKFCLTILKIFKAQTKLSMNSIRFNISMDFENEIEKVIDTLYK